MKRSILLAAVAAAAAFAAMPASATVVVAGACINVADSNGCKFDQANMGNQANADQAEAAYNLYNDTNPSANPDETFNFLGQTGASFSGNGLTSGTWSIGFLAEFLVVKAANQMVIYKLATPASSGTWNTFNITNQRGTPQGLSHLAFLGSDGFDPGGSSVPEPATWAMLLSGFGLVGFAARRRRGALNVAA
jgi:hypothetical protein